MQFETSGEKSYIEYLKKELIFKKANPSLYNQQCYDCGQFVPVDRWIEKTRQYYPCCRECFSNYDDPMCM
jgi:hypothetical protein